MTNSKSSKRALLTSCMSILLCVAMLLGTTFAWFTDSVVSENNVITAGNLDIDVQYTLGDKDAAGELVWEDLDGAEGLFQKGLWEPGHTEVVALKIANNGSLALKYTASMNILSETVGTNKDGGEIKLSDILTLSTTAQEAGIIGDIVLEMAFADEHKEDTSNTTHFKAENVLVADQLVLPEGADQYVIIKVDMPETVGNEANAKDQDSVPSINFGINVLATQLTYENDSFDNQYDADAKYDGEVGTAAELAAALANNKSVKLLNDITLTGEWTPIGNKDEGIYYTGTLDGNGHTISGLSVTNGDYAALIGAAKDATIKNLTVKGTVSADNAAGIVARVEGNTVIENCTSNVAVTGATKAGGIACNVTGAEATFINCVNNGDVTGNGKNGLGGIIGYVNNDGTAEIINCKNTAAVGTAGQYAGAVIGYAAGTSAGSIIDFTNTGVITGKTIGDNRVLMDGETVLAGYCATPANWFAGVSVDTAAELQTAIKNGENVALANDITVDKWIMFAETLSVASGNIITVKIDGLTIDGNGHTLTVNSIESAGNGNRLFYDASKLNIHDLTIKYAEGLAGGIGLKSGVISNVNFVGGGYGIIPGTGDIKVENCTFATNSDALYIEKARDNLTVTGCTFNQPDDKNVILLRGNVEFTNNTVNSGRTVNIVSGSPVVTGNDFKGVRLKVYSAATATISGNTINNLAFEDGATTYSSNFGVNTLSTAAQTALNAMTKN